MSFDPSTATLADSSFDASSASPEDGPARSYDTKLSSAEESQFAQWKQEFAPNDSGGDYDLRGAFRAGLKPGEDGHWPDTFKKPNHPTFSNESIYAKDRPDLAGRWEGDKFIPPHPNDRWESLYAGLDGLDDRVDPQAKAAFQSLDANTDNPREARARSINQSFMSEILPEIGAGNIERNWEAVKAAYANDVLGIPDNEITDSALYSSIATRMAELKSPESTAWAWQKQLGGRRQDHLTVGQFWETINVPFVDLPEAPHDAPNEWRLSTSGVPVNPAIYGGVWNVLKPVLEGVETPLGVATLGGAGALKSIGTPLAKKALATMTGIFTGLMAKGTIEAAPEVDRVMNDPNSTLQQQIEAWGHYAANGAMTVLGALGTVEALKDGPKVLKKLDGKSAGEAAEILRDEAENLTEPAKVAGEPESTDLTHGRALVKVRETKAEAETYNKAADVLDEIDAANEKVQPSPEPVIRADEIAPEKTQVVKEESKPAGDQKAAEPAVEAKPSDKLTSIKNEAIDAELEAMGIEPGEHGAKTTFKAEVERAAETMKADPFAGQKLVQKFKQEPRPPTAAEDALLTHELTRLKLERDASETALMEAQKLGDETAIAQAKARVELARTEFHDAASVADVVGTASGQSLAFRRLALKEDYSLANMERRRVIANEGRPLTPAQAEQVRTLSQKIADTQKAFDDYRSRASELLMSDAPAKARKGPPSRVSAYLSEQASAARQRIKERLSSGRVSSGLDPADLVDHAIIGADFLARGVSDFGAWSKTMVTEFGERVRMSLPEIFDEAKRLKKLHDTERRADVVIAQLEKQLRNEELFTKTNDPVTNASIEAKRQKIAQLRELRENARHTKQPEADPVEPVPPPKPTEAEVRAKQLDRQIADIEEQLRGGEIFSPEKKEAFTSPELAEREKRLADLKSEREYARQTIQPDAEPKTDLELFKERTEKRIAELEEKIGAHDFTTPERTPLHLDKEALRLKAELDLTKQKYERALEDDRIRNLSPAQRIKEEAFAAYDSARSIITTGELSFVLRQGGPFAYAHPIKAARAIPNTLRALFADPSRAHAINLEVLSDPAATPAKAAGVHLVDFGAKLNQQEEMFASKFMGRIPVLRNFEQGGTVFLNKIRLDLWKSMEGGAERFSPEENKVIGEFVNQWTGRGTLGGLEKSGATLNRFMFSARFFSSRVQIATGKSLRVGTMETRKAVATEYARTLIGLGAFYTAASWWMDDPEHPTEIKTDDPTSSDFMKIKIGNTRVDPLFGVQQVIVFGAKGVDALSGAIDRELSPDEKHEKARDFASDAGRFARTKLNPVIGKSIDVLSGKDMTGGEATFANAAVGFVTPMTYVDIYEAMNELGVEDGAKASLLGLLGTGLQTYEPRSKSASRK